MTKKGLTKEQIDQLVIKIGVTDKNTYEWDDLHKQLYNAVYTMVKAKCDIEARKQLNEGELRVSSEEYISFIMGKTYLDLINDFSIGKVKHGFINLLDHRMRLAFVEIFRKHTNYKNKAIMTGVELNEDLKLKDGFDIKGMGSIIDLLNEYININPNAECLKAELIANQNERTACRLAIMGESENTSTVRSRVHNAKKGFKQFLLTYLKENDLSITDLI